MKRKRLKEAMLCICMLCVLISAALPAYAVEGTTYTYTLSMDRSKLITTMDAYLPAGTYLSEIGLSSPEDLFLKGRDLYIADTGNKRIVICSLDTGEIDTFGETELKKPTGISVDGNA